MSENFWYLFENIGEFGDHCYGNPDLILIVVLEQNLMKNGAAMTMLRKYFLHQLKKIIKEGKTVLRENNEKQVCVSSAQKRGF